MNNPKVSIVIPFHWMKGWQYFLLRCLDSIERQSFKDYEIIITKAGSMPVNSNRAIQSAKGEIIKILFLDDYFTYDDSLKNIVDNFTGTWLVTGCEHDDGVQRKSPHLARWNEEMYRGVNTIGSPSVVAFSSDHPLMFDEKLSWMLDCDLYTRLFQRYGLPVILDDINVAIGIGDHQTTHNLTREQKEEEVKYMLEKHS